MKYGNFENQDIIALMNVYLNEFIFRNKLLWSNSFKFFYATLIIILLPHISEFLNINHLDLHILLFRIIGFIMSFTFLYVVLGYAKRLEAITKTYNKIIEKFDIEYRREYIESLKFGKLFKLRTSYIVVSLMFLSLLTVNIILLINNI
jgi:hypothetical protein